MDGIDIGVTHVALPVTDLDASIDFYRRYANLEVIHRREEHVGHGVAWLSDHRRPFALVLLQVEDPESQPRLGGWAHVGVACASSDVVAQRLADAADAGCEVSGPSDDGPPVGYWGIIVDPDGHNLELSFGQRVAEATTAEGTDDPTVQG